MTDIEAKPDAQSDTCRDASRDLLSMDSLEYQAKYNALRRDKRRGNNSVTRIDEFQQALHRIFSGRIIPWHG